MRPTINRGARRTITAAIAAGASVALLAGCSGGSDASGASTEPEETVEAASSFTWVAPSQATDGNSAYERIAKLYEEETGVHIDVEVLPPDSYDQAARTQLQAGSGADLLSLTPGGTFPMSVLTLADAGMLAPITNESVAQTIVEGMEYQVTLDDEVYAQPIGLSVFGIVFNETTAGAAGVAYPDSFDDMLATCSSLGGDPSFVALAGSVPSSTSVLAQVLSAGLVYAEDPDWNQQRVAGETTFAESQGWRAVLEAFVEMKDAGCFQPGAEGAGFDALFGGVLQGKSLSLSLPSLAVAELNRINPDAEISVNAVPPAKGDERFIVAGPGYAFGVNAEADAGAQLAAANFLDWLAQPENSIKFSEFDGSIPVANLDDPTKFPASLANVSDLLSSGDFVSLPSNDWAGPEVNAALGTGLQALLTGQGDIDAVLRSMDQAWG